MPMPLDGGRDVRLLRNPVTGAFDTFDWDSTNNPAFDDSDQHTIMSYLLETEYWANPQRRSTISNVKLDRTGTSTQLQAAAEDAVAPAIANRQLRSVSPSVQKKGPGRYVLTVNYQNRSGHQQTIRLPIGS